MFPNLDLEEIIEANERAEAEERAEERRHLRAMLAAHALTGILSNPAFTGITWQGSVENAAIDAVAAADFTITELERNS